MKFLARGNSMERKSHEEAKNLRAAINTQTYC